MDLHYSQTVILYESRETLFESPMDLHYSQTDSSFLDNLKRLNPLWIYTTLKH